MMLLLAFGVASLWSFYVALLLDRPDLAKVVPPDFVLPVHAIFAVVLLMIVARLSFTEIRRSKSWMRHGIGIYTRNLVVIGLGVVLMIFTCREVLNGVDPSGTRALW